MVYRIAAFKVACSNSWCQRLRQSSAMLTVVLVNARYISLIYLSIEMCETNIFCVKVLSLILKERILKLRSFVFWDITPYSQLKVNRRYGETFRLHLQCWRLDQERNQMKVLASSETCVDFQVTTRRYIPEDRTVTTAVRTSDAATLKILGNKILIKYLDPKQTN
jgi:hypothetical protein